MDPETKLGRGDILESLYNFARHEQSSHDAGGRADPGGVALGAATGCGGDGSDLPGSNSLVDLSWIRVVIENAGGSHGIEAICNPGGDILCGSFGMGLSEQLEVVCENLYSCRDWTAPVSLHAIGILDKSSR